MTDSDLTLHDIIDSLDNDDFQEELVNMAKRKFVEKHHNRKIYYLEKQDVYSTYVGNPRKSIRRRKKEDLIDYLYAYYKNESNEHATFKEIFDLSCEYKLNVMNRSVMTIERYQDDYNRFITKEFGQKEIRRISDEDLQRYIRATTQRLKPTQKALKAFMCLINQVFDYAFLKSYISFNPAKRVNILEYYKDCKNVFKTGDDKIFLGSQIEEIRKYVWNQIQERDYDPCGYAVLLSIETGMRVGEIPALHEEDIGDKTIHIHRQQRRIERSGHSTIHDELPYTKNEANRPAGGRLFPITDRIRKILDCIHSKKKEFGIKSDYLLCNMDGSWLLKRNISLRIERVCKKLGFKIVNNHAFRISLNSNVFIPKGIPVTQRAYLLGHSIEVNLKHYSYCRTEELNQISKILNEANSEYRDEYTTEYTGKKP